MKDTPRLYLGVQNPVQNTPLYSRRDKMPFVTYSLAVSFRSSLKFSNQGSSCEMVINLA